MGQRCTRHRTLWLTITFLAGLIGWLGAPRAPFAQEGLERSPQPSAFSQPSGTQSYPLAGGYGRCSDPLDSGCEIGSAITAPFRSTWQLLKYGWHQFRSDYCANRTWPAPYADCDRASVSPAFSQMVQKGWPRQNLLADPHFIQAGDQLSEAGKERIQAILQLQPPSRRTIFVYASDPQLAAKRIAAVQQFIQASSWEGPPPAIVPTHTPPVWSSGTELDIVRRKYLESAPIPRLPAYEPIQVRSP
ncbi:MAG: hypothetical protein NZ899_05030 [Thermoguttaceae bacterium]|nr:hypothetical protein [Thermoguttaceae bacterium]MDW8078321.1 hypothetical protein [Thermoguttaceae bacterium]